MRIGILGGSFNPPHKFHLRQAEELLKHDVVDKVIFVPNIINPYHDKELVSSIDRFNMVKLMIEGIPNMEVSDVDISKDKQNYTYQTLDEMKAKYPDDEIYLLIGSDNLKEINHWGRHEYLLSNYKIVITKRGNDDIEQIIKDYPYLEKYRSNFIIFTDFKSSDLSSTYVRNLLAKGECVMPYISSEVMRYIDEHNLYRC